MQTNRRALFGRDILEDGVQSLNQPHGLAVREGEYPVVNACRTIEDSESGEMCASLPC